MRGLSKPSILVVRGVASGRKNLGPASRIPALQKKQAEIQSFLEKYASQLDEEDQVEYAERLQRLDDEIETCRQGHGPSAFESLLIAIQDKEHMCEGLMVRLEDEKGNQEDDIINFDYDDEKIPEIERLSQEHRDRLVGQQLRIENVTEYATRREEAMETLPTVWIDGARCSSLEGFYDAVECAFNDFNRSSDLSLPSRWGRNLHSLEDIFYGGFGPERPFRTVLRKTSEARNRLGHASYVTWLEAHLDRSPDCFGPKLVDARAGRGPTLFDEVVGIMRRVPGHFVKLDDTVN